MRKLSLKDIQQALCFEEEDLFGLGYTLECLYDTIQEHQPDSDNDSEDFEVDLKKPEKEKKKNKLKCCDIKPITDSSISYEEAPHPNLLPTPFSYLLIARPGSGKTTLLLNMLQWYNGYFDTIYVFSPTIGIDVSWQEAINNGIVEIEKENIISRFSENKLKKIFNKVKQKNKGITNYPEKHRVLFIFDDIINELPRKQKDTFNKLLFNFRHYGISHITLSQTYKAVPPKMRRTSFGVLLWDTDNMGEREGIIEELSGKTGKYRFARMWQEAVKEKYGFLYVKQFEEDLYKKYFNKFNMPLNPFTYNNSKFDITEENKKSDPGHKELYEDKEEEESEEEIEITKENEEDYTLLIDLIRGRK